VVLPLVDFMAVKLMVWLPIWVATGFQLNCPVAESKFAPDGSASADTVAVGSAAETWNRSSVPGLANCLPGTWTGLSEVTESVACIVSVPTVAATTIPSPGLMASTWKSTVNWPGRVRMLAGSWTDPLELER
jgi:hypothetical protein